MEMQKVKENWMRKIAAWLPVFAIFALFAPAEATRFTAGEHYALKADTIIYDDLAIAVKEATLAGRILGDLIFAGNGLSSTGRVEGSVLAGGNNLQITGPVARSVRAFMSSLMIDDTVGHNVTAFGGELRLQQGAVIGRDVTFFGGTLVVAGKIDGKLTFAGGELVVSGIIKKGAKVKADKITLTSTAVIEGDFDYTSKKEAKIDSAAVITGKINHQLPKKKSGKGISGWTIFWWLLWRTSELVAGFLLIALFRKQMIALKETVAHSFLKTLGVGLLAFIVIPVMALLFAVVIVGLPLTLVLTAFYVVALFLSCNFTGLPVGEAVLRLFKKEAPVSPYAAMTIGVVLIQLLETVPYFGTLVVFVTAWIGLGAIILGGSRLSAHLPEAASR
jgi:cytoskeletal protein CcmA (bactofilin family)